MTAVNRPCSAYSVRKTAAPIPIGIASTTAPTTSQTVPTMAGKMPLCCWPSMTPFVRKGTEMFSPGPNCAPSRSFGSPLRTTNRISNRSTAIMPNAFSPIIRYAPFCRPWLPNSSATIAPLQATSRLSAIVTSGTTIGAWNVALIDGGSQTQPTSTNPATSKTPQASARRPTGSVVPMSSGSTATPSVAMSATTSPTRTLPVAPTPNRIVVTRPPVAKPTTPNATPVPSPVYWSAVVSKRPTFDAIPAAIRPAPASRNAAPNSANRERPATAVSGLVRSNSVVQPSRNVTIEIPTIPSATRSNMSIPGAAVREEVSPLMIHPVADVSSVVQYT